MEITKLEDGTIKVKIKDKFYTLKEIPFSKFKQAVKAVTKPDGRIDGMDLMTKLISLSLVSPKMKDIDVEALPTSESIALMQAVSELYNLSGENFLRISTETSESNSSQ